MKKLKFKNDVIPGYFIDENGKIYDENCVEQKLKLYSSSSYFYFKNHEVHKMMAHSFYGYKEGHDVHHLNQNKKDNRLENLCYLTRSEHRSLHNIENKYFLGKKHSTETKAKISAGNKGKKLSDETKEKMSAVKKKKAVYCVELNKIFEGVRIAAKELSLFPTSITNCCRGKRKTCGGYHFEYYTGV